MNTRILAVSILLSLFASASAHAAPYRPGIPNVGPDGGVCFATKVASLANGKVVTCR